MTTNTTLNTTALALVIIGALNWGLVGLFNFDLVQALVGSWSPILARAVYALVGLAGIYSLVNLRALAVPPARVVETRRASYAR